MGSESNTVLEIETPAEEPFSQSSKSWKLVTHRYPDTDAWTCLWAAERFIVPTDDERQIMFLRAGERLDPEDTEGFEVLYMDTGLGELDQHHREMVRGSSFQLVVNKYNLADDPGLAPILELTRATDNVEQVSPTSIHYYFKGLPFLLKDGSEVDWTLICNRVFEVLDTIYGQASLRARSAAEFKAVGRTSNLPNNLWFSSLWWKPHLREAAFESGTDVALWVSSHGKKRFDVGIQVGRRSTVNLKGVVRALRKAEATKRGIDLPYEDADQLGLHPLVPGWFLHDSYNLIVCGSRSHPLEPHEATKLSPGEITAITRTELAKLPNPRSRRR